MTTEELGRENYGRNYARNRDSPRKYGIATRYFFSPAGAAGFPVTPGLGGAGFCGAAVAGW